VTLGAALALSGAVTEHFDLLIGWTWEYDEDFVRTLEEHAQEYDLTTFQLREDNIDEVLYLHRQRRLEFSYYLDRAFDVDDRFERLGRRILRRGGSVVNPYDQTIEAIDKATMHLEFIEAGLHVPFTIIISPYKSQREVGLTPHDLAHLGRPFIIKPANTTGGGIGVVTGAETLLDVIEERKKFEEDKYLLQEKIVPRVLEGRRAWFRCFYVYGKVFLCWWDDQTHLYDLVTTEEEQRHRLRPLRRVMQTIGRVSGLNFFSSEIALREGTLYEPSRFVVVDYVNDMCDMRTTDMAPDGVPSELRENIIARLCGAMKS
jgi:hypothetical protein